MLPMYLLVGHIYIFLTCMLSVNRLLIYLIINTLIIYFLVNVVREKVKLFLSLARPRNLDQGYEEELTHM